MFRLNNDQASAGVWLVLGIIIAVSSVRYDLGTLDSPGTGFLPFLAGLAISFFSILGLVAGALKKRSGIVWKPITAGLMWKKSLIVMLALLAYALLLTPLGFLLCTILFVGFLLVAVQPQRWYVVISVAIGTAIGAYGIFEVWLKAQLPKGPLGF
jgi:putative tricarboxylic transport membrane protein